MKRALPSLLSGAVIALCGVVGRSFSRCGSLYMILDSAEWPKSLGLFLFWTAILAALIEGMFRYIEKTEPDNRPIPFPLAWAIVFVPWIPYLLCRPPLFGWDTMAQVDMFFGKVPLLNWQPLLPTLIYGLFAKAGYTGIHILSVLQALGFSAALAYSVTRIKSAPRWLRLLFLALFALSPLFSVCGATVEKNIPYALFTLLFTVFAYETNIAGLTLSALMCVLMRHNGIHVVLPTIIVLMFARSAPKKQLAIAAVLCVLSYVGVNNILVKALHIPPVQATEAMLIPIQQTARYASLYSAETPQSEKDVINKIVDYDTAARHYNPELADAVKKGGFQNPTENPPAKDDLKNYFGVWAKQFKRHPLTYLEATLNNTHAYYSFYDSALGMRCLPAVNTYSETGVENYAGVRFDHVFPDTTPNAVFRSLRKIEKKVLFFPLTAPFCRPALYTCLLLTVIAFAVRNGRRKLLALCLPSVLSFLVCIASPVNGDFRYAIAYAVCVPFLFGLCFEKKEASAD